MSTFSKFSTIEVLASARMVADFATGEGLEGGSYRIERACYSHLGAVLADSILQTGLNYTSVVRPRVDRILAEFPDADNTEFLLSVVCSKRTSQFLNWTHPVKLSRFEELVWSVYGVGVRNAADLRCQLADSHFSFLLQEINGIGPKTVDYMACLVGIESIAVDRHIRRYAERVGIQASEYQFLKLVFSYAADLLSLSRREFDAWIWHRETSAIR